MNASDPILNEIRRFREAYAERFNYDMAALADDIRSKERDVSDRLVYRKPRRSDLGTRTMRRAAPSKAPVSAG